MQDLDLSERLSWPKLVLIGAFAIIISPLILITFLLIRLVEVFWKDKLY